MRLKFGEFGVDCDKLELRGPGGAIAVDPQVFQLLRLLIENRDRVVTKDELIDRIWDGRIVSDAAVTSRINLARKAVGDSGSAQRVIRTYPKRGYRFVGAVEAETKSPHPDENATVAPAAWEDPVPGVPGVAVLPFRDLAPAAERDFLAEGLTEEISVALSRSSDIAVIAHRSAMAFEDITPLSDVGRTLHAKYLVQGSVQRAAGRIRVTAKVLDAELGIHIWADRFEAPADGLFEVQDHVTRSIAAVLPNRIHHTEAAARDVGPTREITTYQAYLRAIWTLRRSGDVARAIGALTRLVEEDQTCALAHAQLAALLGYLPFATGRDDTAMIEGSLSHARRALTQDPNDERIQAKAAIAFVNAGEFKRALNHSERALDLNPHSVESMNFRGCILNCVGEHEKGLEYQHAAMRLDPLFPGQYNENVIEAHYLLERYDTAIDIYSRWECPHPHLSITMAACHAMAGDKAEAQRFAEAFASTRPDGFRFADYVAALMRYHARDVDKAHWTEGFRRAGLLG